jgi:FkbM family methyltransferase
MCPEPEMKENPHPVKQRVRAIRRGIYEHFGNARYTPRTSLNGLDEKLEKYLDFKNGVFIEASANDGITQSNTYYLEKGKQWTGLLVEAIPELYLKCRAARQSSKVYNCGLVPPDHPEMTLRMHFANLMSVADGAINSGQIKEHVQQGLECQGLASTYQVVVPALTLASLVEECRLDRIDFLSLDVEGGEAGVLDGLNLRVHRPRHILVEASQFIEVDDLLTSNRYRMVDKLTFRDYLYADEFDR